MEVGSRGLQNVNGNREPDKGVTNFNPEIKDFFAQAVNPIATEPGITLSVDGTPPMTGVTSVDAALVGATLTDSGTAPCSNPGSFTFPSLASNPNIALPQTSYPTFPSFADEQSAPISGSTQTIETFQDGFKANITPAEDETQQVSEQETFDDMVVLKDGMVTVAPLFDGVRNESNPGDALEQFHAFTQEAPADVSAEGNPTESPTQEAPSKVLPEGPLEDEEFREASAQESVHVTTEVLVESAVQESADLEPADASDEVPLEQGEGVEAPTGTLPQDLPLADEPSGAEVLAEEQLGTGAIQLPIPSTTVTLSTGLGEVEHETTPSITVTSSIGLGEAEHETTPSITVTSSTRLGEVEHETTPKEIPAVVHEEGTPGAGLPTNDLSVDGRNRDLEVLGGASLLEKLPEGEQAEQKEPSIEANEGKPEVTEQDVDAIKGRKVLKKFGDEDYLGDVVDYDPESKWFKVVYEDGDEEDLELVEVQSILLAPGSLPVSSARKRPRSEEGADEGGQERSPKKPKKSEAETPRKRGRPPKKGGEQISGKKRGRPAGSKVSESPATTKSPGSKGKGSSKKSSSAKKSKKTPGKRQQVGSAKKAKSEAKQGVKAEHKVKFEEETGSPSLKTPVKSQKKTGGKVKNIKTNTPKSSKGRSAAKLSKTAQESRGLDFQTPETQKGGKVNVTKYSSGQKKTKSHTKSKSPRKSIKLEEVQIQDTPKKPKAGTKRKAEEEEKAEVNTKRFKKGVAESLKSHSDTGAVHSTRSKGGDVEAKLEKQEESIHSAGEGAKLEEATSIGKQIRKKFGGVFYDGVVVGYDKKTKFFKVKYDDGDQEELEWRELELILTSEGKTDIDSQAKPAKFTSLTLMSQKKKTGTSGGKKRKSTK